MDDDEEDGDGYINMTSPEHQIKLPSHGGRLNPHNYLSICRTPWWELLVFVPSETSLGAFAWMVFVLLFSVTFLAKNLKPKSAILKSVSEALTETSQIEFSTESGRCSANLGNVPITTIKAAKRLVHCIGTTHCEQSFGSRWGGRTPIGLEILSNSLGYPIAAVCSRDCSWRFSIMAERNHTHRTIDYNCWMIVACSSIYGFL